MLTKYILHIGTTQYELQDQDLKNWDAIQCSYKRSSFDGVVRSFTSQFEFVNDAAALLWDLYTASQFNASAILEVLTLNDRWEYESRFKCPLDFSTIGRENGIVSINAVDNSLAALIKANKSTKYELEIGSGIPVADSLKITRIPMNETLTYGFTQGTSYEDSEDITVTFARGELPWVGNKAEETLINMTVDWKDDQDTEPGSYILKAVRDVKLNVSWDFKYRNNRVNTNVSFILRVKRNGAVVLSRPCGKCSRTPKRNVGKYDSSESLPDLSIPMWEDETQSRDLRSVAYAIVAGKVWDTILSTGARYVWRNAKKTEEEYFIANAIGGTEIELKARDVLYMDMEIPAIEYDTSVVTFVNSQFVFEWVAKGDDANVSVVAPKKVAERILGRIAGDSMRVHVSISEFDSRIKDTYIMGAESIREISGAKLYSSFDEFCDWMSTVFGYVYYIGDTPPSIYTRRLDFGRIETPSHEPSGFYPGTVSVGNIIYNPTTRKFFYAHGGGYYETWPGSAEYHGDDGFPREDTVYYATGESPTQAYVFAYDDETGTERLVKYDTDDDVAGDTDKTVFFVHRSELFGADSSSARTIADAKSVKYSVNSASIYSTVTIGYEKKDYETVNGRDEFNFNNTYTTGCSVSDKTLSMLSKYRADSYGIEFAIQKRSKDTTDTTSDNDVFFALCKKESGQLVINRDCVISNGINDEVFNGAFSPMACIRANAGYIGLQANVLQLTFASSAGNSEIAVDGELVSSDIVLDCPIATVGEVEFESGDLDVSGVEDSEIDVTSEDGILYRGYLKELDINYAREEAAKYKLIVKSIESCE